MKRLVCQECGMKTGWIKNLVRQMYKALESNGRYFFRYKDGWSCENCPGTVRVEEAEEK